jgi:hypothetical protein
MARRQKEAAARKGKAQEKRAEKFFGITVFESNVSPAF